MHPGRLRTVPVGQYPAAEHISIRIGLGRPADALEVSAVYAMVIIDERDQVRGDERNRAVEGVRLSHPGLGDPAQRQPALLRRRTGCVPNIAIEERMCSIGARIRRDQHVHGPARGILSLVQVAQRALEQSGSIVRTDENGKGWGHHEPALAFSPNAHPDR